MADAGQRWSGLSEKHRPKTGAASGRAGRTIRYAQAIGIAQAIEEFDVVAAAPSSWVRTRSTVVGLDVLSTSTPRFGYPQSQGEPVPQPDAPLVMVYDAGGSVRDLLANHEAAGDFFTFAADADGATGGTPGASNPVLPQRADYDAFGELILFAPAGQSTPSVRRSQRDAAITALEQALLSHLTYRGEQYDIHLRMQYLRARHYDQGTGRFTRVDPFAGVPGEPLTLHKYAYAHGNPASGIDPSGLDTEFTGETGVLAHQLFAQYVQALGVSRSPDSPLSVVLPGLFPPDHHHANLRPDAVDDIQRQWFELKPMSHRHNPRQDQSQLSSYDRALSPHGFGRGENSRLAARSIGTPIGELWDVNTRRYMAVTLWHADEHAATTMDLSGVLYYSLSRSQEQRDPPRTPEEYILPLFLVIGGSGAAGAGGAAWWLLRNRGPAGGSFRLPSISPDIDERVRRAAVVGVSIAGILAVTVTIAIQNTLMSRGAV